MKAPNIILAFLILTSCMFCKNDQIPNYSAIFYKQYRLEFLKSDLIKYSYNPRAGFTFKESDTLNFFRVLLREDSSIRILGVKSFCQYFDFNSNSFDQSELSIKKDEPNGVTLTLTSRNHSIEEVIDYFWNLKRLIEKYHILALKNHPLVNVKEIVFSNTDHLIYKPDTLIFIDGNREFMKYLFKNGKELDKNWIQFSDTISTNYH